MGWEKEPGLEGPEHVYMGGGDHSLLSEKPGVFPSSSTTVLLRNSAQVIFLLWALAS